MREFRTYGSVRGALSNERSYRDSLHSLRSLRSLRSDRVRRVRSGSAPLRYAPPALLRSSPPARRPRPTPHPVPGGSGSGGVQGERFRARGARSVDGDRGQGAVRRSDRASAESEFQGRRGGLGCHLEEATRDGESVRACTIIALRASPLESPKVASLSRPEPRCDPSPRATSLRATTDGAQNRAPSESLTVRPSPGT